jgi:hypothetical protein
MQLRQAGQARQPAQSQAAQPRQTSKQRHGGTHLHRAAAASFSGPCRPGCSTTLWRSRWCKTLHGCNCTPQPQRRKPCTAPQPHICAANNLQTCVAATWATRPCTIRYVCPHRGWLPHLAVRHVCQCHVTHMAQRCAPEGGQCSSASQQ